jgi:DNA-binding winged helix-turn-helix (wHTH) protein
MAISHAYEFAGIRFYPLHSKLEIVASGQEIELPRKQARLLLCLVQRPREVVTYGDLARNAWGIMHTMNESQLRDQIHNVHTTKNQFVSLLKRNGITPSFIEGIRRSGYRLNSDVTVFDPSGQTDTKLELLDNESNYRYVPQSSFQWAVSIGYGGFVCVAFLLEIAYQFDELWRRSVPLSLILGALTAIASASGLGLASSQEGRGRRGGFLFGFGLFTISGLAVFLLGFLVLPTHPITVLEAGSQMQPQPAAAAFFKNIFIYGVPLGVFYILTPVFVVIRASVEQNVTTQTLWLRLGQSLLLALATFWALALVYSLTATFALSDRLQPGPFHSLFLILLFLRFVLWFGVSLACLIWYRLQLAQLKVVIS